MSFLIKYIDIIRPIIRKLADQTLVFADWDGFCEMALPGEGPAGMLRWISRVIMSTGVIDFVWIIPYFILVAALALTLLLLIPKRWRFKWYVVLSAIVLSLAYCFIPVMGVFAGVWLESESAYPVMNPLGTLAAMWLFIAFRGLCLRRGSAVFAGIAVFLAVMSVPLGAYALASLLALAVWRAVKRKAFLPVRIVEAGLAAAVALAAIPAGARFVYGDIAWGAAFSQSHAFRFRWNSPVDVGCQLEQEAAIINGDFQKVLEVAERQLAQQRPPLRMSVAYRILAQYRLGRLPDDIFKYPMPTSHIGTDAEELLMDGYVLLFNYGMLMPARREIYEIASVRGWQPCHFRILGDIAAITGELNLALRYYRELERCPFRGDFAKRRIDAVERVDGAAFSDIAPIADMNETWKSFYRTQPTQYFNTDQNIEQFVYTCFHALKGAPEFMVRMFVTVAILEGNIKILIENSALMQKIGELSSSAGKTSPGAWPMPAQEAVLMYLFEQPDQEKSKVAALVPQNAVTEIAVRNFNTFISTRQEANLTNPFMRTYFFYRAFINPKKE